MGGTIAPFPKHQFFTNNGLPASGHQLFSYLAGTAIKTPMYSDQALTVAHTNPLILDSSGRETIFLGANSYKFVFTGPTDSDPPVSPIWSVDNVAGVASAGPLDVNIIGTAGEDLRVSDAVYLSDGQGGRTPGQWYRATASLAYASTEAEAIGIAPVLIPSGTTGNIVITGRATYNRSALAAGSLYYLEVGTSPATEGRLTATPPANARAVGIADSASSIIMSQFVPIVNASATVAGAVSIAAQTFAGDKTNTGLWSFNLTPQFRPGQSVGAYGLVSGRIHTNVTPVGNVGVGEDDLMSFSMLADTLNTDLKAIRVTAWGTTATNANAKRIRFYFGTLFSDMGVVALNNIHWEFRAMVTRTGLTGQVGFGTYHFNGLASVVRASGAAAANLGTAVTVKLTGEAVANNDIIQEGIIIETVG